MEIIDRAMQDKNMQKQTCEIKLAPSAQTARGDAQRRIVYRALVTLERPATSKEIYQTCKKDGDFDVVFPCKNPFARIRTILQRGCETKRQGFRGKNHQYGGVKYPFVHKDGLWGLKNRQNIIGE